MNYDNKLTTAEFKGHDNVMEFVSEMFINIDIYIAFEKCLTCSFHVLSWSYWLIGVISL